MVTSFPHHSEPDGDRFGPHHYLISSYLLIVLFVYTHPHPYIILVGIGIGMFSWIHCWYLYPVTGALGTLTGLLITSIGVLLYVASNGLTLLSVAYVVATVVGWDDVVQHSFGWTTPLDEFWKHRLSNYIK